ncbi:hypothetical protein TNCT_173561 [Trichonephila clavata]|uniref:Uncharacterized protein n=1 Tax=Trichonephila clavata TaxID=2740835 RepID=A0A8X6IIF4_TRICU|nr:hypothetical protein TNCT_173561 [Trichonephila clavata]
MSVFLMVYMQGETIIGSNREEKMERPMKEGCGGSTGRIRILDMFMASGMRCTCEKSVNNAGRVLRGNGLQLYQMPLERSAFVHPYIYMVLFCVFVREC